MRSARNLFSALVLSVLASACAGGVSGNRTPNEPYQFTSAQPARASSVVAPLEAVNHDGGGWSNIWTETAQLADRPNVAR